MSRDWQGLPRVLAALTALAVISMLIAWGLDAAALWGRGAPGSPPAPPPGDGTPLPAGQGDLLQPASDTRPFTLTIQDGEIVILAGRGHDAPLYRRSGITVDRLAPGDLALLRDGYTVEGLDQAWEFLEGVAEHQGP